MYRTQIKPNPGDMCTLMFGSYPRACLILKEYEKKESLCGIARYQASTDYSDIVDEWGLLRQDGLWETARTHWFASPSKRERAILEGLLKENGLKYDMRHRKLVPCKPE